MTDKKSNILVVDDEEAIRRFLQVTLASEGYEIIEASNGQSALVSFNSQKPDLMILDLGLPDIDGVEVTRRLREYTKIPIIILSVRGSEQDKIDALDAGADDYLTKPFGAGELLARIRVALRRQAESAGAPVYVNGDLEIDLEKRIVKAAGCEVQLTPNEYDLLIMLVQNAGKVLTHRQILQSVWGEQYGNEYHMLHVNISNLRRKIETDPARPRYIVTEPGVGYRLRIE